MSATTLDIPQTQRRPSPGWLDRTAERFLLARLAGLRHGRLTVVDGDRTTTLGTEAVIESASETERSLDAVVTVHAPAFYRRAIAGGSLGVAESYLDGEWSCDDLVALLRLFLKNQNLADGLDRGAARLGQPLLRLAHRLHRNTVRGSRRNVQAHYDLGNDFFQLFLDDTMSYSAATFADDRTTLEQASRAKLERVCRKLRLGPGDRVLEIGTGWGGFAIHSAGQYGCRVTTTTISREQHDLACRRIREAGLSDRVTVLLEDYRALRGRFDKLVSIEMIEAVGHENFATFFGRCGELLEPDGLLLLQGITMAERRYERYRRGVDFIQKHVFPGGCLPSVLALGAAAAESTELRLLHLEDFAAHYERTLREWRTRFRERLDDVRQLGYPERFVRLWDYYLCYCEAAFAERAVGVVQMLFAGPESRFDPLTAWSEVAP